MSCIFNVHKVIVFVFTVSLVYDKQFVSIVDKSI